MRNVSKNYPNLTQEQIDEACAEWQKRLRLQDWDVDVHIERGHNLDSQGACNITQELKYALIRIRLMSDAKDSDLKCVGDMESVLLHELFHIHFDAAIKKYDASIRVNPGDDTSGTTPQIIALEQAFQGIVPYLMSVGRVIPLEG